MTSWSPSPVWSVVDGPWKLASFSSDGNSTFVPNKSYSGPVPVMYAGRIMETASTADLFARPHDLGRVGATAGPASGCRFRTRCPASHNLPVYLEPAGPRQRLLATAPGPTGDERWDVLLAGIAEHLSMRDSKDAPEWPATRGLRRFWFPFDTPGARAQALVHAPAALRKRGVFVADYEIEAA